MELNATEDLFKMKTEVEEQKTLQEYNKAKFETKKAYNEMQFALADQNKDFDLKYRKKEFELEQEMLTPKMLQNNMLEKICDNLTQRAYATDLVNIGGSENALDAVGQAIQMQVNTFNKIGEVTANLAAGEDKKTR